MHKSHRHQECISVGAYLLQSLQGYSKITVKITWHFDVYVKDSGFFTRICYIDVFARQAEGVISGIAVGHTPVSI